MNGNPYNTPQPDESYWALHSQDLYSQNFHQGGRHKGERFSRPDFRCLLVSAHIDAGLGETFELDGTLGAKDTLIVAATGWGQEADRLRFKQAVFDHLLVKPVDGAEVNRLLAERKA